MSKVKRFTTYSIGNDVSMPVDADDHWNEFIGDPFHEQVEAVADDFFWLIQLPWIELTEKARHDFWNEFRKPEAKKARQIAVHGLKHFNGSDGLELLNLAIEFHRDIENGAFKGKMDHFKDAALIVALKFSEIAAKKDHRQLKQLADIMKAGGIDGGTKAGEDSFHGQIIRDFCQLVLNRRTLPTKKQLRESLGLTDERPDAEKLRVALKELGLGGLPKDR